MAGAQVSLFIGFCPVAVAAAAADTLRSVLTSSLFTSIALSLLQEGPGRGAPQDGAGVAQDAGERHPPARHRQQNVSSGLLGSCGLVLC